MLFEIESVSKLKEEKPIEGAFPMEIPCVERCTNYATPEEFNQDLGWYQGNWEDYGTNHRIENGYIVRDLPPRKTWGIRIDTLDELIELQKKCVDELIIGDCTEETPLITIYDGYIK